MVMNVGQVFLLGRSVAGVKETMLVWIDRVV